MEEMTKEDIEKYEKLCNERKEFRNELIKLINRYSLENDSNTPDFIIADYMINSYLNMNDLNRQRDNWYSVILEPGNSHFKGDHK